MNLYYTLIYRCGGNGLLFMRSRLGLVPRCTRSISNDTRYTSRCWMRRPSCSLSSEREGRCRRRRAIETWSS